MSNQTQLSKATIGFNRQSEETALKSISIISEMNIRNELVNGKIIAAMQIREQDLERELYKLNS